jgi:hypothetical protein
VHQLFVFPKYSDVYSDVLGDAAAGRTMRDCFGKEGVKNYCRVTS